MIKQTFYTPLNFQEVEAGSLEDKVLVRTFDGDVKEISSDSLGGSVTENFNVKNYGAIGDGISDDTVSIQNAINACNESGGGRVYFPNGVYFINGALDTTSQSQLYIPLNSYSASIDLKTIEFVGETAPNQFSNPFNPSNSADHPNTGVILKSNLLTTGNVLGARSETVAWGNFSYVHVKIKNISIRVRSMTGTSDVVPVATGINMGNVACFTGEYLEVTTTSKMTTCLEPANSAYGIVMPKNNNFVFSNLSNFYIFGMNVGVDCYEHTHLDKFLIDVCVNGLKFNQCNHSIHVTKGCVARSRFNIRVQNASYFYIDHISFEDDYLKSIATPSWNTTLYDLYDVDGTSSGLIRCHVVRANYGADYSVCKRSGFNSKIKFVKINGLEEFILGGTPVSPPISDALAYWKFEETTGDFIDYSPNGRNAVKVNSPTVGAGKVGNAMLTLASNIQHSNAGSVGLSYNGSGISFAGWFKINTSTAGYQVLFNKGDGTGREYNLYYTKSSNALSFVVYNGTADRGTVQKFTIPENTWFFLYAEMVGTSLKLSINNGTPSTATTTGTVSTNTTKDFLIGKGEGTDSLNGGVDEFAVFNRALTGVELSYLYNGGNGNSIVSN